MKTSKKKIGNTDKATAFWRILIKNQGKNESQGQIECVPEHLLDFPSKYLLVAGKSEKKMTACHGLGRNLYMNFGRPSVSASWVQDQTLALCAPFPSKTSQRFSQNHKSQDIEPKKIFSFELN